MQHSSRAHRLNRGHGRRSPRAPTRARARCLSHEHRHRHRPANARQGARRHRFAQDHESPHPPLTARSRLVGSPGTRRRTAGCMLRSAIPWAANAKLAQFPEPDKNSCRTRRKPLRQPQRADDRAIRRQKIPPSAARCAAAPAQAPGRPDRLRLAAIAAHDPHIEQHFAGRDSGGARAAAAAARDRDIDFLRSSRANPGAAPRPAPACRREIPMRPRGACPPAAARSARARPVDHRAATT
jgi:hypothetical protein